MTQLVRESQVSLSPSYHTLIRMAKRARSFKGQDRQSQWRQAATGESLPNLDDRQVIWMRTRGTRYARARVCHRQMLACAGQGNDADAQGTITAEAKRRTLSASKTPHCSEAGLDQCSDLAVPPRQGMHSSRERVWIGRCQRRSWLPGL